MVQEELSFKEKVYARQTDGRTTDALTVGYLLGIYSVRKSSQESIRTQQIPDNFCRTNLILRNLGSFKFPTKSQFVSTDERTPDKDRSQ